MTDTLVRIKRTILTGRYAFSEKARVEMESDGITEIDVAESIINAVAIYKRLRSRSRHRLTRNEYLYVIQSTNLEGVMVYSKGKLVREHGEDHITFSSQLKKHYEENHEKPKTLHFHLSNLR